MSMIKDATFSAAVLETDALPEETPPSAIAPKRVPVVLKGGA